MWPELIQRGVVHARQYFRRHFFPFMPGDLHLPFFFAARKGLVPEAAVAYRQLLIGPGHVHPLAGGIIAVVFYENIRDRNASPVGLGNREFRAFSSFVEGKELERRIARPCTSLQLPDHEQVSRRRSSMHDGPASRLHRCRWQRGPYILWVGGLARMAIE